MTDRSLAKIDTAALLMRGGLNDMVEGAKTLLRSGLLPEQVNTPEKAVVIMLKGQELGIPPMEAMSRINVIKGKPSLSASLMAALVERAYGPKALIVEEATNDHCTVSVWKPGWDKRRTITFSMADAKQAGILSQMYQKYPRAMLRSRAISEACETHFQSIVGGLYTPEELGADPAEEDIIGDTPAVQTEVATEAKWVPVEDGGEDRVDISTGEVIEAEVVEEDGITDAQLRLIANLTTHLDWDADMVRAFLQEKFGVPSIGQLSKDQASRVINVLKNTPRPDPEPSPPGDGVEDDADPELIEHFNAFLRDLNKITGQDASAIFEDMANPKLKLQRVKGLLLNALKHAIEKCESGAELDELKAEWGDHPAWNKKVQERWGARHEKVTGIPVEELDEVPF